MKSRLLRSGQGRPPMPWSQFQIIIAIVTCRRIVVILQSKCERCDLWDYTKKTEYLYRFMPSPKKTTTLLFMCLYGTRLQWGAWTECGYDSVSNLFPSVVWLCSLYSVEGVEVITYREMPCWFLDLQRGLRLLLVNLLPRTIVEWLLSETGGENVRLCQRDKSACFLLMVSCGGHIFWLDNWAHISGGGTCPTRG